MWNRHHLRWTVSASLHTRTVFDSVLRLTYTRDVLKHTFTVGISTWANKSHNLLSVHNKPSSYWNSVCSYKTSSETDTSFRQRKTSVLCAFSCCIFDSVCVLCDVVLCRLCILGLPEYFVRNRNSCLLWVNERSVRQLHRKYVGCKTKTMCWSAPLSCSLGCYWLQCFHQLPSNTKLFWLLYQKYRCVIHIFCEYYLNNLNWYELPVFVK